MTHVVREIDIPARTALIAPDHLCRDLELFDARGLATWDHAEAVMGTVRAPGAMISFTLRPYRRAGLQ